jgi:recombination protein RecT
MSTELVKIEDLVLSARDFFVAVQSDKSMTWEREAEFCIQVLMANDYSMSIARSNPESVRAAVTNLAAIGVSLNPAKKQAYLVPREGKICLDISYMGLIDLACDTGSIRWAQAALVYEQDKFEIVGLDQQPRHTYSPFATDRGAIVGAYAVAKTSDGDYLTTTMTLAELLAIRDRSSAWKAFVAKKAKSAGPWASDEGEMMKKTVIKRAYKYWPRSQRLEQAIQYLNANGEGIDFTTEQVKRGAGTITGPKECFNSLPVEIQLSLRRKSPEVDAAMPDVAKAMSLVEMIIDEWPDGDAQMIKSGLWYLLDSKTRSAMKAARAETAEA